MSKIEQEILANFDVINGAASLLGTFEGGVRLDFRGKGSSTAEQMWTAAKSEVHLLLCTNDAKYKKERVELKSTAAPAIAVISAFLVSKFGVSAGTAGTLAALALLVPLRVAVNSWCRAYQGGDQVSPEDKNVLREISQGRKADSKKSGK